MWVIVDPNNGLVVSYGLHGDIEVPDFNVIEGKIYRLIDGNIQAEDAPPPAPIPTIPVPDIPAAISAIAASPSLDQVTRDKLVAALEGKI